MILFLLPLLILLFGAAVFILRRGGAEPGPNVEIPLPPPTGLVPDEEIQRLVAQDKKLEAIKRVREITGMGLKESKDYVEALMPLDEEVRALLARGKKIEAVKRVREETGMGLKEAKDYVEALEKR
ncbi:MAG: ribosomal protein L7/L12 [Ardenticatenales bacterium]|nr:ribosomal protein L7/L12 [Ardenticatenales bacterium]